MTSKLTVRTGRPNSAIVLSINKKGTSVARSKITGNSKAALSTRDIERFRLGDRLVYPARGVFILAAIKPVRVGDDHIPSLILHTEDARSILAVPVTKAQQGVVRRLTPPDKIQQALNVLGERRRQSRAVWARRAQEYDARIKTGDPMQLAEVLRDLHRTGEQSFSERQIFDRALERLTAELAAVMHIQRDAAREILVKRLSERIIVTQENA